MGKPKFIKKYIPLKPIVITIGSPTHALARFLADKLQPFVRKTSSFIKHSIDFIHKIQNIHLDDQDLTVSFDVVSLFTKISILEDLTLISKLVDPESLNLIKIWLLLPSSPSKGFSMNKPKEQHGIILIPCGC